MTEILLLVSDHQKSGFEDYDEIKFKGCLKNLNSLLTLIYDSTKTIPFIGDLLTVYADNDIKFENDPLFYRISKREFYKSTNNGKLIVDFWVDDYV